MPAQQTQRQEDCRDNDPASCPLARRWVREGKLPRCGWMKEDVPESPRGRELAPQREAERQKLEAKRRTAMERRV